MGKANFKNYILSRRHGIVLYIVSVFIFVIVFLLSHVALKYVWYPALLCFCVYVILGIYDFSRFRKRHIQLVRSLDAIDVSLENLPETNELIETDYQVLLEELKKKKDNRLVEDNQKAKELEEYLTLWSHQIKTPLTALQLTTASVSEPVKSETQEQIFEIEQYVDMMLQYIRLRDNTSDLVLQKYPLRSMVHQAVKYYSRVFIAKKISVKIDIEEQLKVVTDEKWLVFALKQLLSNALKYTEAGSISIRVRLADSKDASICLQIEDTGIGIAKDDLPRIFERGYTGYNGRKDKKATGLGLYLTNQVLSMLNHSISIDSMIGQGTTVSIWF